jgi:rhodanese-related sulfurtransferase
MANYRTISPEEYQLRLSEGDKLRLIDVREPEEFELARVEGADELPLSRFNEWAGTLDHTEEIVFMCHHGMRSGQVCEFLSRQGFERLYNLAGGIDRWAREVDPNVGMY